MNCLDLRRGVLANPRQLDEAARAHVLECAGCREFLEKQRQLDASLYEALQVSVPDGLADRVLVAQGLRRLRRPWVWAIAATLVLATGLAVVLPRLQEDGRLGEEAIAHIAAEPQSFTTLTKTQPDYLASVLADQGMKLAAAVGEITYLRLCPFDGGIARHLVIATDGGPVTLFLMPEDLRNRRRAVTEANGMTAVTVPASRGTVMIVAARRELALGLERALRPDLISAASIRPWEPAR